MKKLLKCCIVFALLVLSSCQNAKQIVYYQGIDSAVGTAGSSYEIKIQPDDLLMIVVSGEDPESVVPFNLTTLQVANAARPDMGGQIVNQLYLVDEKGTIDFPVLGKLAVAGKTRTEFLQDLEQRISAYVKKPVVSLRIMNFKISLQGEVNNPGTFPITSDRVTLIEALSMAKDLTIYGRRDNILVIREVNGVKSFNRVDITKSDFIHSPYYYLSQNDVVYVEPNKTKINGAKIGPNTNVIISVTSLLITLVTLIITTAK